MTLSKNRYIRFGEFRHFILFSCMLPCIAQASFIESTLGTAVVNDVTASYFNPAALILTDHPQIITQGTLAYFNTQFSGQSTTLISNITEYGRSSSNTNYFSPSLYFGMPATDKILIGLAVVSNQANRNADENSILRYVQSSNQIQDYDIVPAVALKINKIFSVGAGVNFSYANFDLKPVTGFPGTNIADGQSDNQSDGTGVGGNAGFLLRLGPTTVAGFNYRSRTSYNLSGKSIYNGAIQVVSDNYHFKLLTPARSVFSINHFFNSKFGLIGTAQRIQWSTTRNIHVYGVANAVGATPIIVNASVPFYLHNTWLLTLGSHYRINPKWILRVAGSYNQSPANPYYQMATGDSFILGASTGYEINKLIAIDGSYAHAFLKNEHINISGNRFLINGVNQGSRDSISLKLTFNL